MVQRPPIRHDSLTKRSAATVLVTLIVETKELSRRHGFLSGS